MVSTRGAKKANKQGVTTRGGNGGQSSPLLELENQVKTPNKATEGVQNETRQVNIILYFVMGSKF